MRRNTPGKFDPIFNSYKNDIVNIIFSILEELGIDTIYPEIDYINFNIDIKLSDIQIESTLNKKLKDNIDTISLFTIIEEINIFLRDVTLVLTFDKFKKLTRSWKVPDLRASMYMELSSSYTDNIRIRKCKNSTCNGYFEIVGDYRNRIYCSRSCALSEAKRMKRAREKAIKNSSPTLPIR